MVDVVGTASAVLALLGAAEATFTTFLEFVKGVGSVDETVTGFLRESQSLFSLIRAISKKLDELPADLRDDRDLKRLWEPMQVTLKQCKKTVADLTRLFRRLNDTARGSFAQSAIKQIKLQFQDQEIAKLRQRIVWLQQDFQTAMAAMSWSLEIKLFSKGTVDFKKIETIFSHLEQKFDMLAESVKQQRERPTGIEGSELSMGEIQGNMLEALKPVFKSASKTFDILSTAGSQLGGEEANERQDFVSSWAEAVNDAEVPMVMEEAPMESIIWPPDTTRSKPLLAVSPENLTIRSSLVERGIAEYHRSDYNQAHAYFADAYKMGPMSRLSTADHEVSDDTLKAWLWLSEIRVNSRGRMYSQKPVQSILAAPYVNPDAVRIEIKIQVCLDACIISLGFMHIGEKERAGDLCEAARIGIRDLKGTACKEYAEALLALVEILYSQGRIPMATSWRDNHLLKDHGQFLHNRVSDFLIGAVTFQRVRDLASGAKEGLRLATNQGNFPAALLIISTVEPSVLKINRQWIDDYLVDAVLRSDSAAVVALLLPLYTELDRISCLPHPKNQFFDTALRCAVNMNFTAAIGLLVDAGADKNQYTSPSEPETREPACYSLDIANTRTSILAEGVSRGNFEAVKFLLEKGAILNLPEITSRFHSSSYELEPALHVAIRCFRGRQMISFLLENGANTNTPFRDVRPLGLAIYHSGKPAEREHISDANGKTITRTEVVKQLIEKGADVNRRSVMGGVRLTPLQQARKYGFSSIERLLLDNGAVERKITTRRKVRRKSTRRQVDVTVSDSSSSSRSLRDD